MLNAAADTVGLKSFNDANKSIFLYSYYEHQGCGNKIEAKLWVVS